MSGSPSNIGVEISWDRLRRLIEGRSVYLFGDGQIATRTLRGLDGLSVGVVDNFPDYWGRIGIAGLPVEPPASVLHGYAQRSSRPCFVITSTAINEISTQLEQAGFRPGDDFWVSPILSDMATIARMDSLELEVLVSSGSAEPQEGLQGGGVYRIRSTNGFPHVSCVFQGQTHGLIPFEGGYLATTAEHGLCKLSSSLEVLDSQRDAPGGRLHGIAVDPARGLIFVVHSDSDRVLAFNEALRLEFSVPVCRCSASHAPGIHHANDVAVLDDVLLVSMFSASGFYRAQVFDGAIAGIRPKRNATEVVFLNQALTMPHSVGVIGGNIVVLDSFHGLVLGENFRTIAQLPGFARGLGWIGGYWIVGQSKNRNFSLLQRKPPGASIDSGIVILSPETGAFRTIPLPRSINEIHAVVPLNCE